MKVLLDAVHGAAEDMVWEEFTVIPPKGQIQKVGGNTFFNSGLLNEVYWA